MLRSHSSASISSTGPKQQEKPTHHRQRVYTEDELRQIYAYRRKFQHHYDMATWASHMLVLGQGDNTITYWETHPFLL